MKAHENAQFVELVTRIHAVLRRDADNEPAQRAWGELFKTVTVPATLDEATVERLRDWFDERVDGIAPAVGKPCSTVVQGFFNEALLHIAAAEVAGS
jgi:hypothetical protein